MTEKEDERCCGQLECQYSSSLLHLCWPCRIKCRLKIFSQFYAIFAARQGSLKVDILFHLRIQSQLIQTS